MSGPYPGRTRPNYTQRSPSMLAQVRRRARDAWPIPASEEELWAQLAEIVVHETRCRLATSRNLSLRRDETLAQAQKRLCDCTAVPHRQHLFDLITRTGTATPGRTT